MPVGPLGKGSKSAEHRVDDWVAVRGFAAQAFICEDCILEGREPRLLGNAAGVVIITIAGLLGGLAFGFMRAWLVPREPLEHVGFVVSGGFFGSVFGLALAIVLAVLERGSFRSLKKTMGVVAVTAVVLWAIVVLMREFWGKR